MNKQKTGRWVVALAMLNAVSAVTGAAVASSEGKLNANASVAAMSINLHIPHRIQVTELADISLDWQALNKSGAMVSSTEVCIATGTSAYRVTMAESYGTYKAFKISNGVRELDYSASWVDQNGQQSELRTAEHAVNSQTNIRGSQPCVQNGRAGRLAALALSFPEMPDDINASAIYVGALTLLMSVE